MELTKENYLMFLVQFLKKNGIYCEFINEYSRKNIGWYYPSLQKYFDTTKMLSNVFENRLTTDKFFLLNIFDRTLTWSTTRKGFEFWQKIHRKYKEEFKALFWTNI